MRDDQAWSRHNYWSKLPRQMTVMILQKAGVLHMLTSAQFVCTQWRDICTDRSTWDTIRVVDCFPYIYHSEKIIQWAVDRSCGTLFDLDLDNIQSTKILHYLVKRCTKIRHLRVWSFPTYDLERVAANLTLLEDLELVEFSRSLSSKSIETLGEYCPILSSLKIHVCGDENAKTIARSMPQLRRICLFGENFVTDVGVEALLDGCTHLESLDIPQCYIFEITGSAKQKIKKKPLKPTQWRDILEDPSTWSTIRVARCMNSFEFYRTGEESEKHVKDIIRRAVDKSWGGLVHLDLDKYMSGDILSYVVERCTQIRRLRGYILASSEEALRAAAPRLSLLEDLELIHQGTLLAETIETLGRCCPRLTSLKMPIDDYKAMSLARSMPQLRHLKLSNASTLTDVGVKALLDGCSNLESLDLLGCKRVRLYGTLGIKCAQKVKNLKRPYGLENPNYRSSCVGSSTECQKEDDSSDYNQVFEEDIYDVNYMIVSRDEYWSRRQKAKGRGTHIEQLRKERVNKNKLNYDTKKEQKARRRKIRRREMKTNSKREVKNELADLNKRDGSIGYQTEDDFDYNEFLEKRLNCGCCLFYDYSSDQFLQIGSTRSCSGPIGWYQEEDDYDHNKLSEEEEDVYDVNYTKYCRDKCWSRRVKARCRETYIRQLRRVNVNKNRSNTDTKTDHKARRRRKHFRTHSRRKVKKEAIHWNKMSILDVDD